MKYATPQREMPMKNYGDMPCSVAEAECERLFRSATVIGDIAVLSLSPDAGACPASIGDAIMAKRRHIRTVLNKTTTLEGDHRVARYDVLAGGGTVTVLREFGFSYTLDVGEVFFNPRLASERMRVASQVAFGEHVLVPFAGVGPFVVPAAARGARVVAVEKNPAACRFLSENCRGNGVEGRVEVRDVDVSLLAGMHLPSFDRAVIPTPYGMDGMLHLLAPLVRPKGTIHFYTFKKRHQIHGLERRFAEEGYDLLAARRCGNVAPCVSRWVFDLRTP